MSGNKYASVPLQQWIDDQEQWPLLTNYMLQESNLPGPRGNLELAGYFAKLFGKPEVTDTAWALLSAWVQIAEADAKTNDPHEFLPFCAVCACGAHYPYAVAGRRSQSEEYIQSAMNDSRWRMREAAAMGLQYIGEFSFALLRPLLESWRPDSTLLEQRAFVAALAHPPLLKEESNVLYCLELADEIMKGIVSGPSKPADPEHYRVLSKGLEYSLSLFVAGQPERGFAMLRGYAKTGDARMIKIVKSNLGKSRLSKKYPEQVMEILAGLTIG